MRRALVTGGTRGIGAAIAVCLRDAGADVTVTGTRKANAAPKGCRYVACDFLNTSEIERLATLIGGLELSILINNAGINAVGPVDGYDPVQFAQIQQVNVTAPFRLCQAVVPGMRRRRFGRIVNITSIFSVVSKAGRAAYSASKCALTGLTRALALEVAAENVLVNCVAPGFVDTDLTRRVLGQKGMAAVRKQIPVGRLAATEEIARLVRFLASEDNSYVTGQNIVIDGGFTVA